MAEKTIPRSAENIALAMGALCAVRFYLNVCSHNFKCSNVSFNLFVIILGFASCCS